MFHAYIAQGKSHRTQIVLPQCYRQIINELDFLPCFFGNWCEDIVIFYDYKDYTNLYKQNTRH